MTLHITTANPLIILLNTKPRNPQEEDKSFLTKRYMTKKKISANSRRIKKIFCTFPVIIHIYAVLKSAKASTK
jgi:hypothetical protein